MLLFFLFLLFLFSPLVLLLVFRFTFFSLGLLRRFRNEVLGAFETLPGLLQVFRSFLPGVREPYPRRAEPALSPPTLP